MRSGTGSGHWAILGVEVLQRFRVLLRESHPDHGAEHQGAGQRILELTEARRILTS